MFKRVRNNIPTPGSDLIWEVEVENNIVNKKLAE